MLPVFHGGIPTAFVRYRTSPQLFFDDTDHGIGTIAVFRVGFGYLAALTDLSRRHMKKTDTNSIHSTEYFNPTAR